MTESLFAHICHKILSILASDPEFFQKDSNSRSQALEKLPSGLKEYMTKVNEEQFMKDLKNTLTVVRSKKGESDSQNELAKAFASYLLNEVSALLDRIPMVFYQMKVADKRKFLEEKTKLPQVFVDKLSTQNYQEVFENIYSYLKKVNKEIPYIVVQMARDADVETKGEIRSFFKKDHPEAFPLFQVSKHLYGGIKIFVNGKVTDQTWLGKIERFTSQMA